MSTAMGLKAAAVFLLGTIFLKNSCNTILFDLHSN